VTAPALFERSQLSRILWSFRREFAVVALLSLVANLLMLSPTLYMLQIFDRVLTSHSELTLLMLSLIILLFFAVLALAEWIRSRLLVRAGVQFDEALNERIFRAGFQAELEQSGHNPSQALADLTNIRQFLTGNGTIAFFDAPWTPIYIAVSFMLHPYLGWLSILFVTNLVILGIIGKRLSAKPAEVASKAEVEVNKYLFSKLRNSEVVESMGMLGDLRRLWLASYEKQLARHADAQAIASRMQAVVKFVQYTQQSLMLAVAARLDARDPTAPEEGRTLGHQFAGTGASFGFPELSERGRELERASNDELRPALHRLIACVRATMQHAEPPRTTVRRDG